MRGRSVVPGAVAAAVTVVAHLVLLGWNRPKVPTAEGASTYEGPYEPWQVVVFCVFVLLLAIGLGAFRAPLWTELSLPVTVATLIVLQGLTAPSTQNELYLMSDGRWMFLAPLFAGAVLIGAIALWFIGGEFRSTPRRDRAELAR